MLLVALGLAAWISLKIGAWSGLEKQVKVEALFDDVAGLNVGASVTVAGVEVGRVTHLKVDFDRARVGMSLDVSAGIREDVTVVLRARSLLGEKYMALVPDSADAVLLENGAVIGNTLGQVEIDQLLAKLGPVLESFDMEPLTAAAESFSKAFEEDPERLARMFRDAEELLAELKRMAGSANGIASEAALAIQSIASLGVHADDIAERLNRVLGDVEVASGELPAAAHTLPLLLEDARAAVNDARALIDAMDESHELIERVLQNLEEIDKWELRRLLREEGILVRMRPIEVQAQPPGGVVDQRE
jgi:phospholipid/cholesterol/gamma-HCH transport system substrate-binding protein